MARSETKDARGARAPVRGVFGRLPDGAPVEAVELFGPDGMRARVIAWGASLQTLTAPDRGGRWDNVILNYAELRPYRERPEYFGASMGRFANRIGGAAFVLDETRYALEANEGANTLHGGAHGFDKRVWRVEAVRGGATPSVTLSYRSADGEAGFPGVLEARVIYALTGAGELTLTYEATCDRPTVVNLTNHCFFNLGGAASRRDILGHTLMIAADEFTPVDAGLIPTGEMRSVEATPFDFREPRQIGARIGEADEQLARGQGYDHNFVLRGARADAPRLAARLADAKTGRTLELLTTEPGLQFYSGQYLGRGKARTKALYGRAMGLALEPQTFPDAPNKPAFPSARLDPGETYRQVSIYRFSAA